MKYEIKPIHCRPWLLNGLSLKLIESHYENNYGGALRRLNAITEQIESLDFGKAPGYVVNSLKREELIALNSTLLHELYFGNLGGEGNKIPEDMRATLEEHFGTVAAWRREFVGLAQSLAGGSGWVVLGWSRRQRRLYNYIADDDTRTGIDTAPVLVLDMYEHAYHIDFGANATAYVDAFMRNVDWKAVEGRYEDAAKVEPPRPLVQKEFGDLPGVAVEEVKAMLDSGKPVQFIDARPRHYVSRTQDIIDGAVWRDPDRLQEWAAELSKSDPVVVFCVYGFHVGCGTALKLRDHGFDAKYMKGGHSAWKAIGGPIRMNT